ncbi:MAG: RluA family pseudouridine synthase [Minicystis sp.]
MTRISARELAGTTGPFGKGVEVVRPEGVPEGSVVTVMRVPPECAGMRLDRFVQTQLKRTSRTRTQQIVAAGCFAPDARPLRSNDRVKAEQMILLWRAPWDEKAPDVEVPIIYEDEHLVAVNKPPGIPVHPTARYHASTVVKLLEKARPGDHLRLSHRIDRETSGALLLARTAEADRLVKIQFEERQTVEKYYVAITWGWPEQDQFRVELPLEIDPTSKLKVKMRVAAPGQGLASRTGCEVLGRRTHAETGRRYALVRCHLETGRQHQNPAPPGGQRAAAGGREAVRAGRGALHARRGRGAHRRGPDHAGAAATRLARGAAGAGSPDHGRAAAADGAAARGSGGVLGRARDLSAGVSAA